MKKIITLFAAIILVCSANAQAFKFGTITADLGTGFAMYGINAYSPINKETHTDISLNGTLPSFNLEFGLAKFVGVGMRYRRGTYGRSGTERARGADILGIADFHLANKNEKFDLVIGGGFGSSSIRIGARGSNKSFYAKGPVINFHVTPHLYFGKYVGMFLSLGYSKHMLNKHIEAIDSDGKMWTEADGTTWNMGGVYFEFGVAGRFDIFSSKE